MVLILDGQDKKKKSADSAAALMLSSEGIIEEH